MATDSATLKNHVLELLNQHDPNPVEIGQLYAHVSHRIELDTEDLQPPTLRGEPTADEAWKRNLRNVLQHEKEVGALVNILYRRWCFPREVAPESRLEPELAWKLTRRNAIDYRAEGRQFISPKEGQRYRISDVKSDSLTVERLDATKPAVVTSEQVRRAAIYVNAGGGRIGRKTIRNTVAIESAIVALHPRLRWSADHDWIESTGLPVSLPNADEDAETEIALDHFGVEGAVRIRTHRRRERDSGAIREFKKRYIAEHGGNAPCEVCGFDFVITYGSVGSEYIEAHHRQPLHTADPAGGVETSFEDLAFVCANCHRMLHRAVDSAYLRVEELAERLAP